jgi:hypothetical protein
MTKRSNATPLYASSSSTRWVRAAITSSDADLWNLCVWRWRKAASITAYGACPDERAIRTNGFECSFAGGLSATKDSRQV